MYQSYLGASLHEFIRAKKTEMQAEKAENVTDRDVIVEIMGEQHREEFVEDYLL